MSRATKRKHVQMEVTQDDYSHPKENQQIVRVLACRGNNLFEVESTERSIFLVSMPRKFRKNVWAKRGSFLIVEPIEEGDKVKAEIVRILTQAHIKYFKRDNVWPQEFDDTKEEESKRDNSDEDDLFVNTNRIPISDVESSSDDSSTDSDSEESDSDSSDDKEDEELEICVNTSRIHISDKDSSYEDSDLKKCM